MNSPQNSQPQLQEQLGDLLTILLDDYVPCQNPAISDREITTAEIQANLFEHTGVQFGLAEINTLMRARGYNLKATANFGLAWLLTKKG